MHPFPGESMDFWNVFLIVLVAPAVMPGIEARRRQWARLRCLRRLERQRGSRAITLIHRQESRSILGIPVARYIDIEDSEQVLRAIRLTPPGMPIDLILHTPGGLVLATHQIASALNTIIRTSSYAELLARMRARIGELSAPPAATVSRRS
jgi:ClpP class serine protease